MVAGILRCVLILNVSLSEADKKMPSANTQVGWHQRSCASRRVVDPGILHCRGRRQSTNAIHSPTATPAARVKQLAQVQR